MKRPVAAARRRRQRGVSLIELMVSLVIGSFLIIGITQIYIDNQRSYLFQQSQSGNQENARFAEFMLNEYFGKAGYRRAPDQPVEDAFPQRAADTDCEAFKAGSSITAAKDAIGVCIRYQPLVATELDCQGNAVTSFTDDSIFKPSPPSSLVVLAIRYRPATNNEGLENGALTCKSIGSADAAAVELLTGVADMRLDFGLGKNGMLDKTLKDDNDSSRFVSAATWSDSDGPIRAVRYAILLASRERLRDSDGSDDSTGSVVLDKWLEVADDTAKTRLENGDERRIYQIAQNTRNLRNLMP